MLIELIKFNEHFLLFIFFLFSLKPFLIPKFIISIISVWNMRFIFRRFTQFLRNRNFINLFFQEFFYKAKSSLFLIIYKSNSNSIIISSGCTPNSMNIIFTIMRNIKVNHQANVININSSGYNICSNKNINSSVLNSCITLSR